MRPFLRPSTPTRFGSIAATQAAYFIATGLWAVLHRRSFEAISGPKTDYWLVRTFGALTAVIGLALALSCQRRSEQRIGAFLGLSSAAALGVADIVFASRGRISPIYLADAALEAGFSGAWLLHLHQSASRSWGEPRSRPSARSATERMRQPGADA